MAPEKITIVANEVQAADAGVKALEAAQCAVAGIERMPMLRRQQLAGGAAQGLTAADRFNALPGLVISPTGSPAPPLNICDRSNKHGSLC
jgi:hypothetical protein